MSVSTNYGYAKDGNELKKIMDIPSDIVNVAPNLPNLWTHSKAVRHANCLVSYIPTSPPDPPRYTIDTDGC
jgi:hypothetical protein